MSGMTEEKLVFFENFYEGVSHDVAEMLTEIRRLREENERLDHALNGTDDKYGYKGMYGMYVKYVEELKEDIAELEKELKGIGAEQYYAMRQSFWDEQAKNRVLRNRVQELEKQIDQTVEHHVNKELELEKQIEYMDDRINKCAENNQKIQNMYWAERDKNTGLAKQNAELAKVLRFYANTSNYIGTQTIEPIVKVDGGDRASEVLRKYGLEVTE